MVRWSGSCPQVCGGRSWPVDRWVICGLLGKTGYTGRAPAQGRGALAQGHVNSSHWPAVQVPIPRRCAPDTFHVTSQTVPYFLGLVGLGVGPEALGGPERPPRGPEAQRPGGLAPSSAEGLVAFLRFLWGQGAFSLPRWSPVWMGRGPVEGQFWGPGTERPSVQPPGDKGEARRITVSFLPTSSMPLPCFLVRVLPRPRPLSTAWGSWWPPAWPRCPRSLSCDVFCGESV